MTEALVKRLEAVAAKLESYAAGLGSGSVSGPAVESKGEDSPAVIAYDEFYGSTVQPFIDCARKEKDTASIGDWTEAAFKKQREVIEASGKCKKPAQDQLLKFVSTISEIFGKAESNVNNRSAFFAHQKAFAEGIVALGWVANPGASKPVITSGLEAADFYLIKILTAAKAKSGDEQAVMRGYASGLKDTLSKLAEYAHEYHKLGLSWNPKGGDLASFSAAPAAAAGGAPAPPPGPPPSFDDEPVAAAPAKKPVASMGNVFAELSKGSAITSGLKKVNRDQMTHKNPALREQPGLQPKAAPKPVEKKAAAATAAKKPPSMTLQKGTWFVENYEGTTLDIPEIELKQSVYLSKCRNVVVNVPAKCKGVSVDGSYRTHVNIISVLASVEIFNCDRCSVEIAEYCPSVAIDKSDGTSVQLTRESMKVPPQLVCSKISETNVVVPGATDEADPIEIPVPEQFQTTIGADNKLSTVPTAHGD